MSTDQTAHSRNMRKQLSIAKHYLGQVRYSTDPDLVVVAEMLVAVIGDLIEGYEELWHKAQPAPAAVTAPVAPDHGLTGVEQATAANDTGTATS